MHTELLSWSAIAPGATGAAAAALVGDSLTIKNNRTANGPLILALWGMQQAVGFQQLAFPSGHDTTRGYRYGQRIADTSPRLALGCAIPITAQETLTVTVAGSATAGDVELGHALVHYPDLPGVDSRAITWKELDDRVEKLTTVYASLTSAGAGYSGSELITSDSDLLLANRDYAILGGETNTNTAGAITIIGPDTGNVKIGFPSATATNPFTADFFVRLANAFNSPQIPQISSGNKANTFIGLATDENTPTILVTLYLALLKRKGGS